MYVNSVGAIFYHCRFTQLRTPPKVFLEHIAHIGIASHDDLVGVDNFM